MREIVPSLFTVLRLGATSLIAASASAAVPETRPLQLPMRFVGSMPAIEVMVNGKGPYLFGIETGGQGLARIDSSLLEKLGIKASGQVNGSDPSGRNPQTLELVQLASIEIGGLRFADVEAGSRNYKASPRMAELDGILTLNFFANYLLTLDYPAKLVRIEKGELPKVDDAEILPYKSDGGVPLIELRIGDSVVPAHLDSGNMMGGFVLPAALAEKLSYMEEPKVVGRARSMSGEVEIKEGRSKVVLRLGKHEFDQPVVTFPAPSEIANVGSKVLSEFALTFDQQNKRVRFLRSK